jgi:hypothetical protein
MQWFEVRQVQEDLWSVSSQGHTLYLYSSRGRGASGGADAGIG